ncbi:MAG: SDR family NAD(P)-dependent oxidoreductase [Bacilli bacterium]|nr:SDR family NAD(P)-dependent oxidoreductase [Bacilli bacterium]
MKTVVITGSAKGFGYAMLKLFYEKDFNVVIVDVDEKSLNAAKKELESLNLKGKILTYKVDITNENEVSKMIEDIIKNNKTIDIWINNAGVNQPSIPIWCLDSKVINRLIDIDLKGTILCSKLIMPIMLKQNSGQIYNVEGYGSNDATMMGLSIYGTSKRAVTYFTEALAKEVSGVSKNIYIGKITPGIMITNFIGNDVSNNRIELSEKTKNVYNILGDRPETIAKFMVDRIVNNNKNNVKFAWLTNRRAMGRFIKALFGKKNNFFE